MCEHIQTLDQPHKPACTYQYVGQHGINLLKYYQHFIKKKGKAKDKKIYFLSHCKTTQCMFVPLEGVPELDTLSRLSSVLESMVNSLSCCCSTVITPLGASWSCFCNTHHYEGSLVSGFAILVSSPSVSPALTNLIRFFPTPTFYTNCIRQQIWHQKSKRL